MLTCYAHKCILVVSSAMRCLNMQMYVGVQQGYCHSAVFDIQVMIYGSTLDDWSLFVELSLRRTTLRCIRCIMPHIRLD